MAITGLPAGQSLRWPVLASYRGQLVVAGNLFPNADTGLVTPPFYVGPLRGPGFSMPTGPFAFAYPRLAVDPHDARRLHMIWAEFAQVPQRPAYFAGLRTSLWHAVYDGRRWSAPERILAAASVTWSDVSGNAVCDARGALHVVVPAVLSSGSGGLLYLRHDATWHEQFLDDGASTAWLAVALPNHLAIVYGGSRHDSGAQPNDVLTIQSRDGGVTWTPPSLVGRGGEAPGIALRGDRLVVSWHDVPSNVPPRLHVRWRSTDSASWAEPEAFALPDGQLQREYLATTRCEGEVLVAEMFSPPNAAVWWTPIGQRAWRRVVEAPFSSNSGVSPLGTLTTRMVLQVLGDGQTSRSTSIQERPCHQPTATRR